MKDDEIPYNIEDDPQYAYLKDCREVREQLDKDIRFSEDGYAGLRIVGEPHFIYLRLINTKDGVLTFLEQRVNDKITLNEKLTSSEFIARVDLQRQLTSTRHPIAMSIRYHVETMDSTSNR